MYTIVLTKILHEIIWKKCNTYLRNKTYIPVFYRRIKYKNEYVYFLFCDKTWVQMFYFVSKTTRPIVNL